MKSYLKALAHTIASAILLYIPYAHTKWLDLTVATIITLAANYVLSHTIATTNGASANQ